MQQIVDTTDARHVAGGVLDRPNLPRSIHLAPQHDNPGLNVYVDGALRHVRISEQLGFDPPCERGL